MDLVINLNKPKDITSREATTEIKRILKAKKAGHTGTLDPSATGVLLICINKATRLASYLSSLDKEYKTVMKLGEATDTQDAEGTVIKKTDSGEIDENLIENTLLSYKGEILQIPPMFSAIKYKGRPLYEYAKKGIDIHREPRKIHIHHIELLSIKPPFVSFTAICSKGTYIRTLCNDIGEKLGVGAHLFKLERLAIGPFSINQSRSIEELKSLNLSPSDSGQPLFPAKGIYTMDSALSWMPELKIKEYMIKNVKNGIPVNVNAFTILNDNFKTAPGIKIKSPGGEFLAVGRFSQDRNEIKMDVVFGA
ncbi:MAG: tRNA pseudouridine(55) synthase TruB [Nitrospirota bacterium]